jgi:hypothetical protein
MYAGLESLVSNSDWRLKGILSQDDYFLKVLKIKISNFCFRADGFHNFSLPCCGENLKESLRLLQYNHLLILILILTKSFQ